MKREIPCNQMIIDPTNFNIDNLERPDLWAFIRNSRMYTHDRMG